MFETKASKVALILALAALATGGVLLARSNFLTRPDSSGTETISGDSAVEAGAELNLNQSPAPNISLRLAAQNLVSPLVLVSAGDGSGRLFIADQVGLVRIIDKSGRLTEEPFLNLKDKMAALNPSYDERGLLGLAFHPDFKTNGKFYVYYSAPLRAGAPAGWDHTSRVSEFRATAANPNQADPDSEKIILQVDQPQANHNAGQIAFGPDGFLYIPLGDGGGANDTGPGHAAAGNAQDTSSLLGSILRLNVDTGNPYAIPPDNPPVGQAGRGEIYAYGFRNPFHISFDAAGDRALIAGDAGQNLWEEIDLVIKGGNYGWNIKEGRHCFDPASPNLSPANCDSPGRTLLDPVIEYKNIKQNQGLGAAVVGGYVYRGAALPDLRGKYIFGDWSRSFSAADGTILAAYMRGNDWPFQELKVDNNLNGRLGEFLLGFGQDADNELYILTSGRAGPNGQTGKVYKILPGAVEVDIKDFAFRPQSVTVQAGTKIRWINKDSAAHTITAAGKFDSGNITANGDYEVILAEKGVYNYICAVHPSMTGTITAE